MAVKATPVTAKVVRNETKIGTGFIRTGKTPARGPAVALCQGDRCAVLTSVIVCIPNDGVGGDGSPRFVIRCGNESTFEKTFRSTFGDRSSTYPRSLTNFKSALVIVLDTFRTWSTCSNLCIVEAYSPLDPLYVRTG